MSLFVKRSALLILVASMLFTGQAPPVEAHGSGGFPIAGPPMRGFMAPPDPGTYVNYETPHVSPLSIALNILVACNTPDNRLEVYAVHPSTGALTHTDSIPVGYGPVSAKFRTSTEVWVVNHVSDSINIVNLNLGHVTDTIQTADEPTDIAFTSGTDVLVSCSRPDIIQIFHSSTHLHIADVPVLGEDPRAMASGPMGNEAYVAIFDSGNSTTIIGTSVVGASALSDGTNPYSGQNPPYNDGVPGTQWVTPTFANSSVTPSPPDVPLIVRKDFADSDKWKDDNGADWTSWITGANASKSSRRVGWDMIDNDVVKFVTASSFQTPSYIVTQKMNACMAIAVKFDSVNTVVKIAMVGTDSTNEVRFEPNVTGTFIRTMLSITDDSGGFIALEDMNEAHLEDAQSGGGTAYEDGTVLQAARNQSIGDPRGVAFNLDGTELFVTGMGSNNVIVLDSETGLRLGGNGHTIAVGAGPTGIVHHGSLDRVYVLNKFDASVSVIDDSGAAGTESVNATVSFYDPTPDFIHAGRVHFYNTHVNSGLGQIACASCHIDGRMDRLAWDLGDPGGAVKDVNFDDILTGNAGVHNLIFGTDATAGKFHFMKGPMTTQTLQDIVGKEPHHWRGDRDGIEEFAGAFAGLQGRDANLDSVSMQEFEDFLGTLHFMPNPFRNLDNSLPGGPSLLNPGGGDTANLTLPGHFSGGRFFGSGGLRPGDPLPPGDAFVGMGKYISGGTNGPLDGATIHCVTCHTIPLGSGGTHKNNTTLIMPGPNGEAHLGMVDNDGAANGQPHMKIPHLRNQLDKIGYTTLPIPGTMTPKVSRSGFGVLHDGTVAGLGQFIQSGVFVFSNDQEVADLVAFTLNMNGDGFNSNELGSLPGAPGNFGPPGGTTLTAHARIGHQITLKSGSPPAEDLNDLTNSIALAKGTLTGGVEQFDIVVNGVLSSEHRSWYYLSGTGDAAVFQSDRAGETTTHGALRVLGGAGTEITYTVVPEGSGQRMGIDRDEDDAFNSDESDFNTDNTNPDDHKFVDSGAGGTPDGSLANPFTTVASGVSAVSPSAGKSSGVHIQFGSYNESMTITKRTHLIAVGGTVVIGAP